MKSKNFTTSDGYDFVGQYKKLLEHFHLMKVTEGELAQATNLSVSNAKNYRDATTRIDPRASVVFTLSEKFKISPMYFRSTMTVAEWLQREQNESQQLNNKHYDKFIANLKAIPEQYQTSIVSLTNYASMGFANEVTNETAIEGTREENKVKVERRMLIRSKKAMQIDLTKADKEFEESDSR